MNNNEDNNASSNNTNNHNNLEWWRLGLDALKWIIGGVVAIIGFFMIRPHEQGRLDRALQLEVYKAYLSASDTTNIELWQRKLNLMKAFTEDNDKKILAFINIEQSRINDINKYTSELATINKEYKKLKADMYKLKTINYNNAKSSKTNKLLNELSDRIKQLDAQKKTYSEKLTSYGIVNVTLSDEVLTIGANSPSIQRTSAVNKQNLDIHNANVPLTGQGNHGGAGP